MLSFHWPFLFLLLPLPLAVIWLLKPIQKHDFAALRVPFYEQLVSGTELQQPQWNRRLIDVFATILAWVLLITAAARPTLYGNPVPLPNVGRDLMIAIDVSQSMEATDLTVRGKRVDRLSAVKYVLDDFISDRASDRLGLILFGTQAFLQAPLTFDHNTIRTFMRESEIGIAGRATAIGDAIGLAVKRLQDRPSASRVLILLTDGKNTSGNLDPLQAADLASKIDLKIYTIGVGASRSSGNSFASILRSSGSDLDEATLLAIAGQTGGQYFRAENTQELQTIYKTLDELERIESDQEIVRPVQSILHLPLAGSLFFALLVFLRRSW